MRQLDKPDTHTEAALYWSAVSLMVCEGLPLEEAANQLGVAGEHLRLIMERRATYSPFEELTPAPLAEPVESEATYC